MLLRKTFFRKFASFFSILIITISTLSADSSLSVNLALKKQDNSGSILVTLTNTSDEPINVLKWDTPLEEILSANIFNIKNGKQNIIYNGRLVKRGQPEDSDYILFEGGESRTVTVNLPRYYNMLESANYKISYRGKFSSLTEDQRSKNLKKSKYSQTTLVLPFTYSPQERPPSRKLSAQFNSCSQENITVLNQAHDSAIVLARTASRDMNRTSNNTTAQRYVEWFGVSTTQRQQSVTSNLSKIYNALDNQRLSFDCSCTEDGTYAYVYPNEPYNIFLCGSFWRADLTGTDSKAGTIIHELSHFFVIAGTNDHVYGQNNAKQLAITSPDNAINNADSYEFFAEDTPHLSMGNGGSGSDSGTGNGNVDRFENARLITTFPLTDSIDSAGSKKLYRFIPSKSAEYAFYTTGSLDTYGILYDSEQHILRQKDDMSNSNYNFAIYYNLVRNRTYYLEVAGYQSDVGRYTLSSYSLSRQKNDFNGDTMSDIFWRSGYGNYLWYMNANGTHRFKNIGSKAIQYKVAGVADFNYDGITDILWRSGYSNSIWYMNANGTHRFKNIGSKASQYKIVGVADFNDDGVNDILWRSGHGNYIWYMNANGTHRYKNIGSKASQYKIAGIADFNADGIADILWRNGSSNSIWYMNANGTHRFKNIGSKATQYKISGVADFNADGIVDILWRSGHGNSIWYMNANGTHRYKNIGSKASSYKVSKVADFNGDGRADILWRNGFSNSIWYMNINGTHQFKNIGSKATSFIIQK